MAKLPMQKIEMVALLKDSRSIIERLQRRGVVELCNIDDEELVKINANSSIMQFERSLSLANEALEQLSFYAPEKGSILGMLNGRTPISTESFAQKKEKSKEILSICKKIADCSVKINECKNNISRLETQADILKPWESLELPQNFKSTKTTRIFIGTLPTEITAEYVYDEILKIDNNAFTAIDIISKRKEQSYVTVMCHKDYEEIVFSTLREFGFVTALGNSPLTVSEEINKIKNEIIENTKNSEIAVNTIKGFDKKYDDIHFLIDYLTLRRDKYAAVNEVAMTQNTVVIYGYIPKKYVNGIIKEFESKYIIAINITDPYEDEDIPVLLSNNKFVEPVEGITQMYALPNKRDVDPSGVMAFFYYLFFGMMLSDAGYGLLMVIGTTLILSKTTIEGSLKKSMKMFQYCGISTLFWGALFGSWFGDLPQIIASNFFGTKIATTAIWFEPLTDPMKLLLFSFLLGICHLFLGLAVNFRILLKEGKPFDAICEVVPVYLTVIGVAPIAAGILTTVPASIQNIGKYLALIGAISIVLTAGRSSKNIFMRFFGGIYGLYNIATGYLSDILSYSRLLALGLATGSIAGVINLIATMPSNPVLKAVMLIIVGIVGHTANLGINLLGAYVHADRLQFVELFSKFYEGGGRAFSPLKSNTKYIKFEKENIYE